MSNYREIWEHIEQSRCKPTPPPFEYTLISTQLIGESSMTLKEAAVQEAIKSGAVQAWLCGQDIQWRVAGQVTWKDFDKGGKPDFTVSTTEWRPSPIKDPEIKWFAIKDCEPQHGQRCLISDGEVVHFDRWEGDDWKKRGKTYYPHWSPLPKPAKVLK